MARRTAQQLVVYHHRPGGQSQHSALIDLRPGRFDRQVQVTAPDLKGRARILGVHAKGKPLAADVDMEAVARRTPETGVEQCCAEV